MPATLTEVLQDVTDLVVMWTANQQQFADWMAGTPTGGFQADGVTVGGGHYPLTNAQDITIFVPSIAKITDAVSGPAAAAIAAAAEVATLITSAQGLLDGLDTVVNAAYVGAVEAKDAAVAAKDLTLGYRDTASTAATTATAAATTATTAAATSTAASSSTVTARDLTLGYRDAAEIAEDGAVAARIAAEAARDAAAAIAGGDFQAHDAQLDAVAAVTWTAGTEVLVFTGATTAGLITIGAASGNILNKASGDALYQGLATNLTTLAGYGANDMTRLSGLATPTSTGILSQITATTFARRTMTTSGTGLSIANGSGAAGDPTFSVVTASQAEAEAGTDTGKVMTAQRVTQAIAIQKGAALGLATLNSSGKVPAAQLDSAFVGGLAYQGTWNASTNVPFIPASASAADTGHYYKVSVAGYQWNVGDWVISDGVNWEKIDNSDAVGSVAGKTGVVTLDKTDVGLNLVDNTTDVAKPVSVPQQTALDLKQNASTAIAQGLHTIWVPATSMWPRAALGAATGTFATTTNKIQVTSLDYDASSVEYAQFAIRMPKSWNEGAITASFTWSHAATTTNFGVEWLIRAIAVSDTDTIDAAPGSWDGIPDTGGTTNSLYISPYTAGMTVGGSPQPQDWVVFEICREVTNPLDTMAIDARLHGVTLLITVNAANDS